MKSVTTAQFLRSLLYTNFILIIISKIVECIVKSHLFDHLTSNNLDNPHQSVYCKHHSTETALLYMHDHLINTIGSRKISCVCFLCLSAASDPLTTISYSSVLLVWHLWQTCANSVMVLYRRAGSYWVGSIGMSVNGLLEKGEFQMAFEGVRKWVKV